MNYRQSTLGLLAMLVAILGIQHPAQALQLDAEIARMPADKRPSQEQQEAAAQTAEDNHKYQQELWQKLEPQLADWQKLGKPYLPKATFPTDLPQAMVPAFPGAEGAGAHTFGGRGGKVYVVTNLEDGGPGSFREACEAAGPRLVVFNVAGILQLKSPLHILAPYLTIAGQTAPGDGVCVAGFTTLVDTHDVVIRYMRFRRGATNLFDRDDCLGGQPIGNVIVDHCSCSWGLDENLSMYRHVYKPKNSAETFKYPTLNLTIQWCVTSEALDTFGHAFGGTWGGLNTTFHHNLLACNTGRNPSIGMSYDFNYVNNVVFNWRHRTMDGGDQGSLVNCINNYYKPGPATPDQPVRHRIGIPQPSTFRPDPTIRYGKWYVSGNIVEDNKEVTADNWKGIQFREQGRSNDEDPTVSSTDNIKALIQKVQVEKPFPLPPVTIETAKAAYGSVLDDAGATLPHRDPVDVRVIKEVRTGTVTYTEGKGIIKDIKQVGGYPNYSGTPVMDVGADGIPAWWKNKYKLDVNDATLASKDLQGDGYTVVEKYLAGLDPTKKIDWSNPRSNVNTLTASTFKP